MLPVAGFQTAASEACPGGPRTWPQVPVQEPVPKPGGTDPARFPFACLSRPDWGQGLIYLDYAAPAEAPIPNTGARCPADLLSRDNANFPAGPPAQRPATEAFEGAREKWANLHRCGPPRAKLCSPGKRTSEADNLGGPQLAANEKHPARDEILLTADEHPSIWWPWQFADCTYRCGWRANAASPKTGALDLATTSSKNSATDQAGDRLVQITNAGCLIRSRRIASSATTPAPLLLGGCLQSLPHLP